MDIEHMLQGWLLRMDDASVSAAVVTSGFGIWKMEMALKCQLDQTTPVVVLAMLTGQMG
jgi:hypothetical protein